MNYLVIGSALEGNKGAASMLEASIQSITNKDKLAKFTLFSLYPDEDKALNNYQNLKVLATKPIILGLIVNPLCLLYRYIPPLRPILIKNNHVSAIKNCDVYLDQAGITFVDGRGIFLLYNIAILTPGLLLKKNIVKCSQALGPFNGKVNAHLSKIILPKINHIFARGDITLSYLKDLRLKNVSKADDYGFLLEVNRNESKFANKLLLNYKFNKKNKNVGIYPSIVMEKKLMNENKSYSKIIAKLIDSITDTGINVYIIPHSQRLDKNKTHNNDLPVCQEIFRNVKNKENCTLIEDVLSAQQLREIISKMDFNICGRFHAMVSSLSVKVPVMVTGWNHKYEEVLDSFEVVECAVPQKELSSDNLIKKFQILFRDRNKLVNKITKNLPAIQKSAYKNTEYIISGLDK